MNIIESLEHYNNAQDAFINAKDDWTKQRYDFEARALRMLASHQLNLEKNRIKPNFETMSIQDILVKIREELAELEHELNDTINFNRAYSELGDCAAVIVGLLAKLVSMKAY